MRRNAVRNPRLDSTATGWASLGAGTNTGRVVGAGPAGTGITAFYRVAATAAHTASAFGISAGVAAAPTIVEPGQEITLSVFARSSTTRTLSAQVRYYTDATLTTQVGATSNGSSVAASAGVWADLSRTVTPPAGAHAVVVDVRSFNTAWASGQTLDATGAMVEDSDDAGDWWYPIDGDRRFGWEGTPHLSPSLFQDGSTAVTLVGTDDDGVTAPQVTVSAAEVLPGTATMTLHRIAAGQDQIVPGVDRVPAASGFVRIDPFPALGVPNEYRAEMFDDAGNSLGQTDTATIVLAGTPIDAAWFQSPHDPRVSVRVQLLASAGSKLEEQFNGQVHQIGDRRILIASGGTGLDDLDMSFWTKDITQYRAALAVLKHAKGAVVIRTPPPMEVPRVLYLWVPRPRRFEVNLPGGNESFDWQVTGTEVSPPSSVVIAAIVTYARYASFYGTYRAFRAAFPTYRGHALNPPPEV